MPEDEQIITEADLARMFAEEDAQDSTTEAAPLAEPEGSEDEPVVEPESPEIVPEPEPQPGLEDDELPGEEPIPDGTTEAVVADHLAWAQRRNLTDFEAAAKLAYEQERFLGRRASEIQELRDQLAALQEQQPPQQEISPEWIAQAIGSPDPGRFAFELAASGNWDAYGEMMQAWESVVGETVTMGVHNQILATLQQQEQEQQQVPEQDQGANVRRAFEQVGVIDLDSDPLRPTLLTIADELGGQHPLIQALARGDANAALALLEMARMRTVTTTTVRLDGTPVVDNSRQAAARVTGSGASPSRTPPPENPFAAEEEEWKRMGVLPVE